MNNKVYIAICIIPTLDKTITKTDIFSSLPKAQAYKQRQEKEYGTVFCNIYESCKVE